MILKERERIVKALECCLADRAICDNCPIQKECESNPFDATLARYALALITELTEEIKDLEADYDRVYEQAEADILGNMADGGTSCHWCIAGHKRATIQKMQTMIKEECLAGGIYPAFVARVVENVGKRLLEENDG